MKNLLILADDLTGALDTGVQFAAQGIETCVYPSIQNINNDENIPVQVINTNSRHIAPNEAGKIIKTVVAAFKGHPFIYKKTDSCLRGNIGAEMEALMEVTENKLLPFVPAYPALKRVTRNGFQYLDGKPIHESAMAKDPLNPIDESFIPAIIKKQSMVPVRLVPVNGDIPALQNTPEIFVFDAEEPIHLKNIADELYKKNLLSISAGCAGFAEALMQVLPLDKQPHENAKVIEKLPILIISGSLHPVSVNQVKAALKHKIIGFSMTGEKAALPGWFESTEAKTLTTAIAQALKEKGICIFGTDAAFGDENCQNTENTPEMSHNIANALGEIVSRIMQKMGPLHLVVFGGDSLLGIINTLGYNCIVPKKEIQPGIVVSSAGRTNSLLITKAGAFGDNDAILRIADYINRGD